MGVVLAREGGGLRVLLGGRECDAVLRGKAKRQPDRAVAGDRVRIDPATIDHAVLGIDGVEPRSSLLARRIPGGRGTRAVVANVDQVVVVTATVSPAPLLQLIDRLLVVAEANDIPPAVVINKIDLEPADAVVSHLRAAGYTLVTTSIRGGIGIEALRELLAGKESVLTGASGVGKSSLLNALEPGLGLRIGEISAKVMRGTQTTVAAVLVPIPAGGFVADTPGFSDVGVWEIDPRQLPQCFPEFIAAAESCRFADCSHRSEPGCAVRHQVDAGAIPASRYESYTAIRAELEALPRDWE